MDHTLDSFDDEHEEYDEQEERDITNYEFNSNMFDLNMFDPNMFDSEDDDYEDDLFAAIYEKNTSKCLDLIKKTTYDFNKRDLLGNTHLFTACKKGLAEVATQIIMTKKANLGLIGSNGVNSLGVAHQNKLHDVVELLIGHDVNLLNLLNNDTILDILQKHRQVLKNKLTNDRVIKIATAYNLDDLVDEKCLTKYKLITNDLAFNAVISNDSTKIISEIEQIKLCNKLRQCIICCKETYSKFIFNECSHVYCLDEQCCDKIESCPVCRTVSSKKKCFFVEEE